VLAHHAVHRIVMLCVVTNLTNGRRNSRASSYRLLRSKDPHKRTRNLIACAFKGAIQVINVSLIVSAFLLLIESALAAQPTLDTAITSHPKRQANGVFPESLVATKKNLHAKAASPRTDKATARGG
jgi:hypothetical protein